MSSYEKAQYIAEKIGKWTRHKEIITADDVLKKCESQCEIDWWYMKIRKIEPN